MPHLSTLLSPLYQLLRKDINWSWKKLQEDAFNKAKQLLQSSTLIVHYNCQEKIIISCDTSQYGLEAVLAHKMDNGLENPISRTLSPAEKKYLQLEKEGLAIIFTVKKLHQYLSRRKFKIYSDHETLKYIFSENCQILVMAASRIQRWSLLLSSYEFEIEYRPGSKVANVVALSRLTRDHTRVN